MSVESLYCSMPFGSSALQPQAASSASVPHRCCLLAGSRRTALFEFQRWATVAVDRTLQRDRSHTTELFDLAALAQSRAIDP